MMFGNGDCSEIGVVSKVKVPVTNLSGFVRFQEVKAPGSSRRSAL